MGGEGSKKLVEAAEKGSLDDMKSLVGECNVNVQDKLLQASVMIKLKEKKKVQVKRNTREYFE